MKQSVTHVLSKQKPILKICGIKNLEIAYNLYLFGVEAIGIHVWRENLNNRTEWNRRKEELHNIIEYMKSKY